MGNNTFVRFVKEKKKDVSGDENLLHFSLKLLYFSGLFPYERICNTPRNLKRYHAYQITLHIIYCPILFSQIVKLYMTLGDMEVVIETVTHIVVCFGGYILPVFINWNEVYKLICKIDMSMQNKILTQNDRKKREILRETHQQCKSITLFMTILGVVGIFCNLYDIFILHFVESIVGVEHKYKINTNAANIYESLLLEKYPFSCWTPFGEKTVAAHLAMYLYTAIPVFMMALRAASFASIPMGTLIYISLQFKFVNNSLENLSNMEDPDTQIEQNTSSSPEKQHTCKESNYRNIQVPATDGESFHTPSQAHIPECSNKHENTNTSITIAPSVKDQGRKADPDRPPSDSESLPENCLITIIKNHQEAIT
jgi:hypothetical protein